MRMGHGLRFLRQDRHVAHSGQKPRRSVGPGDPRPSRGGQGGCGRRGRWTRSGRAISSTRPARKPFPRPSSPFWRAGTSRTPSATPSPWAATATPWPPSQEASPRRHTVFPIGLRKRPSPIWTPPCWMWWSDGSSTLDLQNKSVRGGQQNDAGETL